VTVLGKPEQSALIAQARELVQLARHHGYRLDELLDLIQTVA
jgi:GntR family transcriptional regulator